MPINKYKTRIKNYLFSQSNKIKINSQDISKGDVFVALQGSNTHGCNFIENALNNGAKYVLTDKKLYDTNNNKIIETSNVLNFLENIAKKKRKKFKGKVIAITGSVGKTTIIELLNFFCLQKVLFQLQ